MKKILAALLMLPILCFSQTKTISVKKVNILTFTNTLKCSNNTVVNVDNYDTSHYVVLTFRNEKYSTIVDTKVILIDITSDSSDLVRFKNDLNKVINDINSDDDLVFTRKEYSLTHSGGSSRIFLADSNKASFGFIALNTNQCSKIIEFIDSILTKVY